MFSIRKCPLPDNAILRAYQNGGAYTDCFSTDVVGSISHEQFVAAFYTTSLFKLERKILEWTVSRPSTDLQARELAGGASHTFSAWHVEKRCPDQLLMSDYRSSTRSWFMVAPITINGAPGTRLYFGSAVIPQVDRRTGKPSLGAIFRTLLGFHKIYSVALLRSAKSRLRRYARGRRDRSN